jgi:hypothetical protein
VEGAPEEGQTLRAAKAKALGLIRSSMAADDAQQFRRAAVVVVVVATVVSPAGALHTAAQECEVMDTHQVPGCPHEPVAVVKGIHPERLCLLAVNDTRRRRPGQGCRLTEPVAAVEAAAGEDNLPRSSGLECLYRPKTVDVRGRPHSRSRRH